MGRRTQAARRKAKKAACRIAGIHPGVDVASANFCLGATKVENGMPPATTAKKLLHHAYLLKNKSVLSPLATTTLALPGDVEYLRDVYHHVVEQHYVPEQSQKLTTCKFRSSDSKYTFDDVICNVQKQRNFYEEYCVRVRDLGIKSVQQVLLSKNKAPSTRVVLPRDSLPLKTERSLAIKQLSSRKILFGKSMSSIAHKTLSRDLGGIVSVSFTEDPTVPPCMIILRDVLSHSALVGMHVLAIIHVLTSQGWMKGCQASGLFRPEVFINCRKLAYPMCAHGAGNNISEVKVSKTMGSGRVLYKKGKRSRVKSFQIGGYLDRQTFHKPFSKYVQLANQLGLHDLICHIQTYFQEIKQVQQTYVPCMLSENSNVASLQDDTWMDECMVGANLINNHLSEMHMHEDKPSCLPALITCINPAGNHRDWKGGELVLGLGNYIVPYSNRDVVLLNGSLLHGVLPIKPSLNAKRPTRFSLVHFSRRTPSSHPTWRLADLMSKEV